MTFGYALRPHGHNHLSAVFDRINATGLNQLHKLSFPRLKCDLRVLSAFPSLRCVEFGEAILKLTTGNVTGGFAVEPREAGWSVPELVDAAKDQLVDFDKQGNDQKAMPLKSIVELPGRTFKVTCFILLAVPLRNEWGKGRCIMVALCFDWDSGRLLQRPATTPPGDLIHLQRTEGRRPCRNAA